MAQGTVAGTQTTKQEGFGATQRRDAWWVGPSLTFLGIMAFLVYGTWAAWQGDGYEIRQRRGGDQVFHDDGSLDPKKFPYPNKPVAPYLSPFYSPLVYDPNGQSPHAWIGHDIRPGWLPGWFPFSAGFLILAFPGLFRLTCYYYRKAYYRAFWADPPACAVGEPRKSYWGENRWPLLFQNAHRYTLYFALIFLVILTWDALSAFRWPILPARVPVPGEPNVFVDGLPTGRHTFGVGLGTLIMVVNIVLLTGFTFGCNSFRHLVGGRLDCFTCPNNPERLRAGYKLWRFSTWFNVNHMQWAWLSLFWVGFTDFYIRMCAMGVWTDPRLI
jgi:hypothetical protein